MRIVLTCNYSPWSPYCGGGQRSTHMLASALADRGHRVDVVYTRSPLERFEAPEKIGYGIRWAAFASTQSTRSAPLRPLNAVFVARVVAGLLEGSEKAVVHSQGEEGALVPRLARERELRFVVTPRYPSYPRALLDPGAGPIARAGSALADPKFVALGMALRGAGAVCPTSEYSARQVISAFGIDPARFSVVPNGLHDAFFEVERAKDAHRGPIVFYGRMARSKGVHQLARALVEMGDEAPASVFIGRGDELPAVRRGLDGSAAGSRARFLDWMPPERIAEILSGASACVLPSLEESFGNTMAEAMAAGVPLISTRAGSIPEVAGDGRNAVLVEPGDHLGLKDAMGRVLSSRRLADDLSRVGRRRARERFSWSATAEAFEGIYLESQPR